MRTQIHTGVHAHMHAYRCNKKKEKKLKKIRTRIHAGEHAQIHTDVTEIITSMKEMSHPTGIFVYTRTLPNPRHTYRPAHLGDLGD
jgi:hypothetical protein